MRRIISGERLEIIFDTLYVDSYNDTPSQLTRACSPASISSTSSPPPYISSKRSGEECFLVMRRIISGERLEIIFDTLYVEPLRFEEIYGIR
jgi:hypothetical protein